MAGKFEAGLCCVVQLESETSRNWHFFRFEESDAVKQPRATNSATYAKPRGIVLAVTTGVYHFVVHAFISPSTGFFIWPSTAA